MTPGNAAIRVLDRRSEDAACRRQRQSEDVARRHSMRIELEKFVHEVSGDVTSARVALQDSVTSRSGLASAGQNHRTPQRNA
jgi:hypothetical protein